jgi:RNA polymerase sigma factor (sigma-70 family)
MKAELRISFKDHCHAPGAAPHPAPVFGLLPHHDRTNIILASAAEFLSGYASSGYQSMVSNTNDQELLRDFVQNSSEDAFAALVHNHIDLVYSAAMRMVVDPHLAQDVTQSVFLALARSAPKLQRSGVLSGWLHRTTRNLAAMTVRGEVRRRNRENEAALMSQDSETKHHGKTSHLSSMTPSNNSLQLIETPFYYVIFSAKQREKSANFSALAKRLRKSGSFARSTNSDELCSAAE